LEVFDLEIHRISPESGYYNMQGTLELQMRQWACVAGSKGICQNGTYESSAYP
jgi:hypothetical protein